MLSTLHKLSTLGEWLSDEKGKLIIDEMWKQRAVHDPNYQKLDEKQREEELEKLIDIPLLKIFQWAENSLPMPAEELLETLLAQLKG